MIGGVELNINLTNACSYKHKGDGSTCMSQATLEKLKANEKHLNLKKPLDAILAEKGKTLDELGLLLDPRIITVLGKDTVVQELHENYKPIGPTDWSLFNNFVEDNVMRHLGKYDPTFLGLDVNLMDFQDYKGSLTRLKIIESSDGGAAILYGGKQYKSFGCVMNTLKMAGDLTRVGHWVALFGDFRQKHHCTIEYFNSSGRAAPAELFAWMKEFAATCPCKCEPLNVSNIQHQHSDTECGIYAIYFITARIVGYSYKCFRNPQTTVTDAHVNKFRANMFNDHKIAKGEAKALLESHRMI